MDKKPDILFLKEFSKLKPIDKEQLALAFDRGMVKKSDLKNGSSYIGICRNSSVAKWSSKDDCFYYIRNKFGNFFIERINHPEDDDGYDLFIPIKEVVNCHLWVDSFF